MIAIDKILKDRKTFISFSIHDSLVLDFSSEDSDILAKIVHEFSDTDLGKFKVNVKYGKNFKNMLIVWNTIYLLIRRKTNANFQR